MDDFNNNIVNDEVENKKKKKWPWQKWILIIVIIIGIGYTPLYIGMSENHAWVHYQDVTVITLNGTIISHTRSSDTGNYTTHNTISISEWFKLMGSSFIINDALAVSQSDLIVFDAGNHVEYALNPLRLSYTKIYDGPSYPYFNPSASIFSDIVDELLLTYTR